MPNAAFSFGEAEAWVQASGLNSSSLGYIRSYRLDRTPVLIEDGSSPLFRDRLSFESPWIDDELADLYFARGPIDFFFIRWTNEDDLRLRSCSITRGQLTDRGRSPGEGMVESITFTIEAISLA